MSENERKLREAVRNYYIFLSRQKPVSFTTGADPESEKWDNRKPFPVYSFDVTEHESILQYLRGFY